MKLRGAVIERPGVHFAIAAVKRSVIDNRFEAGMTLQHLNTVFPGMHVVLVSQDSPEAPAYYGRSDLVQLMNEVSSDRIEWQEYTIE
ncbi:MAG: hypothetical protein AB1805_04500 [Nitrospirota bacterium]